jgi:c(7)-type cytochrome triheme protein
MEYVAATACMMRVVRVIRLLPAALLFFLFATGVAGAGTFFDIPPPLPPDVYGNILINRTSEYNGVKAASFSHWSHRVKYTCRVCHTELGFEFRTNATEITEKANKEGRFCGACHNGREAFGHTAENCDKCHNGNIGFGKEKFGELKDLPASSFGNKIDWVAALNSGAIRPKNTMEGDYHPVIFEKTLILTPDWQMIPPAVFPHKAHTQLLDCSNCHPDIFNIKKKTTKHFAMARILKAEFCGVCHLSVAFPLDDCKRCHKR